MVNGLFRAKARIEFCILYAKFNTDSKAACQAIFDYGSTVFAKLLRSGKSFRCGRSGQRGHLTVAPKGYRDFQALIMRAGIHPDRALPDGKDVPQLIAQRPSCVQIPEDAAGSGAQPHTAVLLAGA